MFVRIWVDCARCDGKIFRIRYYSGFLETVIIVAGWNLRALVGAEWIYASGRVRVEEVMSVPQL